MGEIDQIQLVGDLLVEKEFGDYFLEFSKDI